MPLREISALSSEGIILAEYIVEVSNCWLVTQLLLIFD